MVIESIRVTQSFYEGHTKGPVLPSHHVTGKMQTYFASQQNDFNIWQPIQTAALLDILHICLCQATILCIPIQLCSISWMFFTFLLAMAEVYLKEGDNEYSKGETNNAIHFYSKGLQVSCKDIKLNARLYSNRAAAQLLLGNNWSIMLDQFCIHFDRDSLQSFTVRIEYVKETFCCVCSNLSQRLNARPRHQRHAFWPILYSSAR